LESFGLAALEAMACEVPVIATNVGGLPEVVTPGVDGYLVAVGDVAGAARHAVEILSSPDRAAEMGAAARASAAKNYCSDKIIPLYENYYRSVLQASS
jgi:glycosyltransferase involved in cell wall biosynthesis